MTQPRSAPPPRFESPPAAREEARPILHAGQPLLLARSASACPQQQPPWSPGIIPLPTVTYGFDEASIIGMMDVCKYGCD
ncbi:unnamed protein product [Urochloa humidicola]